jgi:large repetitive protein
LLEVRRFLTFAAVGLTLVAVVSPAEAGRSTPVTIAPVTLYPATSGVFYSAVLRASGGTGPYAFSVVAGRLPSGLGLSRGGTLSGVPDDAPGLFAFTARVVDATGLAATAALTFTVATPEIVLTSVALPPARVGRVYRRKLVAQGGSPRYRFRLAKGQLPRGVHLGRGGVLSGTPRAAGVWLFTVQIADSNGIRGSQTLRLLVHNARR